MELVKDLGVVRRASYSKRRGIFKCACGGLTECDVSAVRSGRITKCRACSILLRSLPKCPINGKKNIISGMRNRGTFVSLDVLDSNLVASCICSKHGAFTLKYKSLCRGSWCTYCAQEVRAAHLTGATRDVPCILYYLYFPELKMFKIGITTTSVEERWSYEVWDYYILFTKQYTTEAVAVSIEQQLLSRYHQYRYNGPALLIRHGSTELITTNIINSVIKMSNDHSAS